MGKGYPRYLHVENDEVGSRCCLSVWREKKIRFTSPNKASIRLQCLTAGDSGETSDSQDFS